MLIDVDAIIILLDVHLRSFFHFLCVGCSLTMYHDDRDSEGGERGKCVSLCAEPNRNICILIYSLLTLETGSTFIDSSRNIHSTIAQSAWRLINQHLLQERNFSISSCL